MSDHATLRIYTPEPLLKCPGQLFRGMARDLLASRELAWRLMIRNLSAMYRQTIFGYVWAFLPPIMAAVTFIMLRKGGVTAQDNLRIPHPLWVICGAFLWQTFADGITGPLRLVTQAKPMLTKIDFPREALLMASAGEVLFNFCIRLLILAVALVWFGVMPGWQIILLPLPLLALVALGMMVGVLFAPFALLYQDVEKGVPLILPFVMLLSGAVVALPEHGTAGMIGKLNPIYPLLEICRSWLTGQPAEHLGLGAVIAVAGFIVLLMGWLLYRVSMPHIISRIGN